LVKKIKILDKNLNFGQKSKCWSKIKKIGQKIQMLVKNQNIGQKLKTLLKKIKIFWQKSKLDISINNIYFIKVRKIKL